MEAKVTTFGYPADMQEASLPQSLEHEKHKAYLLGIVSGARLVSESKQDPQQVIHTAKKKLDQLQGKG